MEKVIMRCPNSVILRNTKRVRCSLDHPCNLCLAVALDKQSAAWQQAEIIRRGSTIKRGR